MTPGLHPDMPAEVYHADPCPTPSMSAGMINDLLIAPALCRHNSRRLNPDYEPPGQQDKFTLGTVRHIMFLEPHTFAEKVAVIEADDWRTKAAKDAKAEAIEAGRTPILAKNMRQVEAARAAFAENAFAAAAFDGGMCEASMFWRHPIHGFWCRARPDFIATDGRHLNDYKATANAGPREFGRHAYSMGYHRRAAWYLEGARIVFGRDPEHYWFVNQETKAPYLTSVVELDMAALEAGQSENDRAAELFARCLNTSDWFGYRHASDQTRDLAFRVGLPSWAHSQIEEGA